MNYTAENVASCQTPYNQEQAGRWQPWLAKLSLHKKGGILILFGHSMDYAGSQDCLDS